MNELCLLLWKNVSGDFWALFSSLKVLTLHCRKWGPHSQSMRCPCCWGDSIPTTAPQSWGQTGGNSSRVQPNPGLCLWKGAAGSQYDMMTSLCWIPSLDRLVSGWNPSNVLSRACASPFWPAETLTYRLGVGGGSFLLRCDPSLPWQPSQLANLLACVCPSLSNPFPHPWPRSGQETLRV